MNVEKKLSALKEYVEGMASSDADVILKQAQRRSQRIREEYSKKAEERYKEIVEEAKKHAESAMNREITQASAKVSRMFMNARNEIFKDALDTLKSKIEAMVNTDSYKHFLESAMREAIEFMGMKRISIRARKKDRRLIEKYLDSVRKDHEDIEITLSDEDADITGGVIAVSEDGRVIVENTLESKFDEIKERFLLELSSKLK